MSRDVCLGHIASGPGWIRTAGDRHLRPRREVSHPEHLVHRGLEGAAVHGAAAGDVDGVAHHGGAIEPAASGIK